MTGFRRTFTALLVLALAGGPLAPAFAGAAKAPATDAAAHAHHAQGSDQRAADTDAPERGGCAQHDECQGRCCSACGHCVVALPGVPAAYAPVHAEPIFLVVKFLSGPPAAALPRPPQLSASV